MRIDSHQHFWTYDSAEYPWIADGMDVLRRDFLPADLTPLLDAHALDGSIAVQARQTLDETRFLLELARASERVVGVVGWVDLCSPEVESALDEFSGEPALKGVRHIVQDEPDDAFLLRPDFARGIDTLQSFGLAYDVLVYPKHLANVLRFLERHPDQPFVLDHLAKPEIAKGNHDVWSAELRAAADHPHLWCKLSGMVTEADWADWKPEDLHRYLDTAYEAFGPDRVLYGSDWPVCLLAGRYDQVLGALEDWARRITPDERAKLFGGNAARFYGLSASDS